MVHVPAAGDDGESHLGVPAEDDLRRGLAVLFAQLREHRLNLEGLVAVTQGVPAHELDAVLIQGPAKLRLGEVRMRLHLDELGHDLPFGLQLLDILALKVGNADGLCFAFFVRLFQLTVACQPVACGLMDVKQIYIVHAQTLQRLVHRVLVLILAGPELGGEEDLLPLDAAGLHAPADGALIDIGVGGIHQGIAHLQRFPDAVLRVCRGEHIGYDAHDRALDSVVQYDVFHDDLLSDIRAVRWLRATSEHSVLHSLPGFR